MWKALQLFSTHVSRRRHHSLVVTKVTFVFAWLLERGSSLTILKWQKMCFMGWNESLTKTGSERKLYFLPRQLDALLKDYSVSLSVYFFLYKIVLFSQFRIQFISFHNTAGILSHYFIISLLNCTLFPKFDPVTLHLTVVIIENGNKHCRFLCPVSSLVQRLAHTKSDTSYALVQRSGKMADKTNGIEASKSY